MKLIAAIIATAAAQKYNNNNNNNNSGYGTGYGDPHFMVQTLGQEAICFDHSPETDKPITLVNDPVSGVVISAETGSHSESKGRTFMTKVSIMSPEGAMLTIDNKELTSEHVEWNAKLDVAVVGDVTCKKLTTEDRSQYHCEIENGPKFLIRNHTGHKTLSFAVTDTTNLSEKTRGVIGRFVKPDGYAVIPNDENTAAVISDGVQYNATKHHFHHQEQCWTLKHSDVEKMFE